MTGSPPPGVDPLVELADDERVAAAIAERQRERWLRDQAADLATLAGTLHDLAEHGRVVTITTPSGRAFTGRLLAVASDHLVLATTAGQHVALVLDALATVRREPAAGRGAPMGDRGPAQDLLLVERLADWLVDSPRVAIAPRGPADLVQGTLSAVGENVVTVTPDGSGAGVWVALAQVEAVAIDHAGRSA